MYSVPARDWMADGANCNVVPGKYVPSWRFLVFMMTSSNGKIFRVTGPGGDQRSLVNSPQKDQWRGALMFSLICARTNAWMNNCEAGKTPSRSLWRHCNVVMVCYWPILPIFCRFWPAVSTVMLPRRLSSFRPIRKFYIQISRLQDF